MCNFLGGEMSSHSADRVNPIAFTEGWLPGLQNPSSFPAIYPLLKKLEDHIQLRQLLIYCKGDINQVLQETATKNNIFIHPLVNFPGIYSIEFRNEFLKRQYRGFIVAFPADIPFMHRVVTISKTPFWEVVIGRLSKKFYPNAKTVFLKQDEIRTCLENLENSIEDNLQIRVIDATLRAKREYDPSTYRQNLDTDRVWREKTIRAMFDEAAEKNQWFTSITFALQQKPRHPSKPITLAKCKIDKRGFIFCDNYFEKIDHYVVTSLLESSAKRLKLYQRRGLREREFVPSPPLEITYDSEPFQDLNEIRRFGKVMLKYPNSSIAIYHGNPYYHASFADFSDGSSFEVWILSTGSILISPQIRSSPQALERMTSYIFSEFKEGNIKEYVKPTEPC